MQSLTVAATPTQELVDILASSLTEVVWRAPGGDALGHVTHVSTKDRKARFIPNDSQWGLARWVNWTELDMLPGLIGVIRTRTGFKCEAPDCDRTFDYILTMDEELTHNDSGKAERVQAYRCERHGKPMLDQALSYTPVTWQHHICTGSTLKRGQFNPHRWRIVSAGLSGQDVDTIRGLYRKNTDGKEGQMFKFVPEFPITVELQESPCNCSDPYCQV